jgi:hypothetical protein
MLKDALKAKLPLITVYTTDTINCHTVLAAISGEKFVEYQGENLPHMSYCFHIGSTRNSARALYHNCLTAKTTLVIINPEYPDPLSFNGGVLRVPESMIVGAVEKFYTGAAEDKKALVGALRGLTYKEIMEVMHMAIVMHGQLSPSTVRDSRRDVIQSVPGVRPIALEDFWYQPSIQIKGWLGVDGLLFNHSPHQSLVPRGLMFKGPPGTGKTMGAKYIAQELGVPLYMLDITALLSKYHGESEQNLQAALRQIEQLAPCIMLVDEAEKLFVNTEDSGATSRMLSGLLWWLQERKERVLTILTTNNESSIPKELYRAGRIDRDMDFPMMNGNQANDFTEAVLGKYQQQYAMEISGFIPYPPDMRVSHAQVLEDTKFRFKLKIASQISDANKSTKT